MPKDKPISQSNRDSDIRIRQLQLYLRRPEQISAAPHPFIKKATRQSVGHGTQQPYPPLPWQWIVCWRDRLYSLCLVPIAAQLGDRSAERLRNYLQRLGGVSS